MPLLRRARASLPLGARAPLCDARRGPGRPGRVTRPTRGAAVVALLAGAALAGAPATVRAQDLSTHVLDLARGVGGTGIPVSLERQTGSSWQLVARAVTDTNGRVRAFPGTRPGAGAFRLVFDLRRYAARWAPPAPSTGAGATGGAAEATARRPFFPEIVVQFEIADTAHYHVPVVVSPFGYSTYRGN